MTDGDSVYIDSAFRAHALLSEWGVGEDVLNEMTDDEVIEMYHAVLERRNRMDGDPT